MVRKQVNNYCTTILNPCLLPKGAEADDVAAPFVPFPFGRFFGWAEAGDFCFKTGVPEDVSVELVGVVAKEEPEVPRRRAGKDDDARGLAA